MKAFKFTLILIAVTSCFTTAFTQSNDRLTIRVYEQYRSGKIMIIKNQKVIENIELKNCLVFNKCEECIIQIDKTLNKFLNQNYEIISSVSGACDAGVITTYILEKEE